jgi:hypothetical protein
VLFIGMYMTPREGASYFSKLGSLRDRKTFDDLWFFRFTMVMSDMIAQYMFGSDSDMKIL